jgi:hypothetical protein
LNGDGTNPKVLTYAVCPTPLKISLQKTRGKNKNVFLAVAKQKINKTIEKKISQVKKVRCGTNSTST